LQALHQWREFMDTPTGVWLGFINAIYWAGSGLTYLTMPWLSNRYGRKLGVYIGYGFLALGVGLCGVNNDVGFILSRFFVGCASACFASTVPLLINEIAYPTHRGIANALFMCGWYVGGTIAAFIVSGTRCPLLHGRLADIYILSRQTFGTRNMEGNTAWRIPTILQVLIPVLSLPGLIWAPESPRWLISNDRVEEARVLLERWHANGDKNSALVNYEMMEITETLRAERDAHDSASYAEMFKTPGNRHRLFISVSLGIFVQWCKCKTQDP
jgi:MFS family permease